MNENPTSHSDSVASPEEIESFRKRNRFQGAIGSILEMFPEVQEVGIMSIMDDFSPIFAEKYESEDECNRLPESPEDDADLVRTWANEFRALLAPRIAEIRASQQSSQDTSSANA